MQLQKQVGMSHLPAGQPVQCRKNFPGLKMPLSTGNQLIFSLYAIDDYTEQELVEITFQPARRRSVGSTTRLKVTRLLTGLPGSPNTIMRLRPAPSHDIANVWLLCDEVVEVSGLQPFETGSRRMN